MQHGVARRMRRALALQLCDRVVKRQPLRNPRRQLPFPLQFLVNQKIVPRRIILRRRNPMARQVGQRQFNSLPPLRVRRLRHHRPDRALRLLPQNPCRRAFLIVIDLPALRVFRRHRDARQLQRSRVRHHHVSIHPRQHHRMPAAHFIQIPSRRHRLHRPQRFVPSLPDNPFPRRRPIHLGPQSLAKLLQRLRPHQVHIQPLRARARQVHMRVVESRHHKMPAQVHHPRLRPLPFCDLVASAHRHNSVPAHRHRLRPLRQHQRGSMRRASRRRPARHCLFHARVNVPVNKNHIRFHLGSGILRRKN